MKQRDPFKPSDSEVEWYMIPLILLFQLCIGPMMVLLGPHLAGMK
jgi:hypothetical protein